ncbi:branched-chain amino acid ABC transporter substrate-binding protein [Burkholderia multivorans]|uniref:branched-chain amino acid ABC transporter substrate-binding protein n=1 Tax=Burkholderia multivorans TaxID=87883 RepID=UPI0009E0DC5C|nr:branched-chain amino acid ABC transporter substrate-binding protein [Burkholderia multivorans]SAK07498.1 aBC branched chain amino acid family transporter, periplasmic ligand binding protein [Burkholderia multivorans]SAK29190.1 aBC branched chain amino acid family transporter, periplasmic ligand binding protein [Burkholderia multivorans]HEM7810967.1 branched-chain amino acid ABC transporter substrate-binding protein [Burkholderia multivorans]
MASKAGFGKARETYSMHVKLAYAVSVAAPVAMVAGCSKKSDDEAGREAAACAAPPASDVRVARTGRAASWGRRIAQPSNVDGTRLTIEDIHVAGRTHAGSRQASVAARRARGATAGTRVAAQCAPAADGGRASVAASPISVSAHSDSTKQRVATARRAIARGLLRPLNSDAVPTGIGGARRAATRRAVRASGVGAHTLGGGSACAGKAVEPARGAVRNLIGRDTGFAPARTEPGAAFGKPDAGRFGMLPYDFKEAHTTVLDVVTI